MRAVVFLSTITALSLFASIEVEKITVEENAIQNRVDQEEIKFTRQQDLAQILQELHPEINMVRASAIGNDIVLRGFKRDDINVLIDGAKIYGACPNRMDPPAMHISISDIKSIQLVEGPFDVENFGSMGGAIKVETKEPTKGFGGDVDITGGSFSYKKFDGSIHGGDKKLQFSLGATYENSDQYEDGDGKSLVEQNWAKLGKQDPNAYQERYKDLPAYTRTSTRAKVHYNIDDRQVLKFSMLTDKATNVLYPAFQMDAQLDKTFMINGGYEIKDLAPYSKKLSLDAYYSSVVHDMGTKFRNAALNPKMYRTHHVKSKIKGVKLKNSFDAVGMRWVVGADGSLRNWNGICLSEPSKKPRQVRIPDVDTKNRAIFVKAAKSFDNLSLSFAARYDKTSIDANGLHHPTIANILPIQNYYKGKTSKDYSDLSGYIAASYKLSEAHSLTLSLGQGIRVPDAQELYFIGFMMGNWSRRGNPDLKESKNREIDLTYHGEFDLFTLKTTLFYSKIKDYIYAYSTNAGNKDPNKKYLTWTNIDAHIYGGDMSVDIPIGEFWLAEGSIAYQRGKKDDLIPGQSDRDLAMIPPLRGRLALSFDDGDLFAMAELLASAKYKNIDSDNGEQVIKSWSVLNLKASKRVYNNVTINLGVDNVFDRTYALNNTYVGRALIGGRNPVLINEPGRFFYANVNFTF